MTPICYNETVFEKQSGKGANMIKRKVVFIFAAALFATMSFHADGRAAENRKLWTNMCASCHDGKTAPDMESLRLKYVTTGAFAAAVRARGHRCMNILKNDESLIKKIGKEIGLKDAEQG
jgi:hypothetical protein